jgi:hypothetical protein
LSAKQVSAKYPQEDVALYEQYNWIKPSVKVLNASWLESFSAIWYSFAQVELFYFDISF